MTTEKKIERKLQNEIKKRGGLPFKFLSPGYSGVPDRIVLLPNGKVYFVEIKSENGKVSQRQKLTHDKLFKLGFAVLILQSENDLSNFLNLIDHDL